MNYRKIQCRVAPSIGELEGTHKSAWGTEEYTNIFEPCVFFGVYGLPDFYTLNRHRGKRYILWAGTDITHFLQGYFLDDEGKYKLDPFSIAKWINDNCDNWVENEVEQMALESVGIKSRVCPSFMGDKYNFKINYQWSDRPRVYASCSGNEFEKYGWNIIERIADKVKADFYLYGNTIPWETKHKNVIVRGRLPKKQMNEEISKMQCGLRTLDFDGASEILIKSVLQGQYPISRIKYPFIANYETDEELISELKKLRIYKQPNIKAKKYYLEVINKYPWNRKK